MVGELVAQVDRRACVEDHRVETNGGVAAARVCRCFDGVDGVDYAANRASCLTLELGLLL